MGSNYMKRFHSFPVLGSMQNEATTSNMKSKIYMLSEQTLEKIFRYLSYHEIMNIRSVCSWFYFVAGSILNKKFLLLSDEIERKQNEVMNASKLNVKLFGYLKVLYIVSSEIGILKACCEDYVLNNTFYFSGGTIIDTIESIMCTSDTKEASNLVTDLLIQIDRFLDNFDQSIEPLLHQKFMSLPQSWLGKKIVHIFECSLNCDKNIKLWPNQGSRQRHCHLKGVYESRKVYSIKAPPSFPSKSTMSCNDIFLLVRYLRNYVRWNNTLNYQFQDDFEQITSKEVCVEELSNMTFIRKLNCNRIPFGPMRLIINIDLYCLKIFAPTKYQEYLENVHNCFDSKESIRCDENDYRLHITLEVGYLEKLSNGAIAKLKLINVVQKNGRYYLACDSKN